MNIDDCIVEVLSGSIDVDTLIPSESLIKNIGERLARNGRISIPGVVIIPETCHLIHTRSKLNCFIENILQGLITFWNEYDPEALSPVNFLYGDSKRIQNYSVLKKVLGMMQD